MTFPEGASPRPEDEHLSLPPEQEEGEGEIALPDVDPTDRPVDDEDPDDTEVGDKDNRDDEQDNSPAFLLDALTQLREDPPRSIAGLDAVRSRVNGQLFVKRTSSGKRIRARYYDRAGNLVDSRLVQELVRITEPQSWLIAPGQLDAYVGIATASNYHSVPVTARELLRPWRPADARRVPGPRELSKEQKKRLKGEYKDRPDTFTQNRTEADQVAFERIQKPVRAALAITHEWHLLSGNKLHPSSLRRYNRMLLAHSVGSTLPQNLWHEYAAERGIWFDDEDKPMTGGHGDHEPKPVSRFYVLTDKERDIVLRGESGGYIKELCIVSSQGATEERSLPWKGGTSQQYFDAFKGLIGDRLSRHHQAVAAERAWRRVQRHDASVARQERREESRGNRPADASAPTSAESARSNYEERIRHAAQEAAREALERVLRSRGIGEA